MICDELEEASDMVPRVPYHWGYQIPVTPHSGIRHLSQGTGVIVNIVPPPPPQCCLPRESVDLYSLYRDGADTDTPIKRLRTPERYRYKSLRHITLGVSNHRRYGTPGTISLGVPNPRRVNAISGDMVPLGVSNHR